MQEGFRVRQESPATTASKEILPTSHADAVVDTQASDRLEGVRQRLGLSRREVLAAGTAATLMRGEQAQAAQERYQEPGLSPEAQAHYEACLGEMRESARSHDAEIARLFVARRDGTFSWVAPSEEQTASAAINEMGGGAVLMPDRGYVAVRDRSLAEGAVVIDQHTHPTRMLSHMPADGNEHLRGRVPPSPIDVLGSIWVAARLENNEVLSRYRREAVTEQGVWRYGPVSKEAATSLSQALDAGDQRLRALDTRHRIEGRALGRYLLERVEEGVLPESFRELGGALNEGRLGHLLAEHPNTVAGLAEFGNILGRGDFPRPPREARAYLRQIEQANEQVQTALAGISGRPDARSLDVPYLTSESIAAYQERWGRLGVRLSFRSFST